MAKGSLSIVRKISKTKIWIASIIVFAALIAALLVYHRIQPKSVGLMGSLTTDKELVKGCADSGVYYASVNSEGLFYLDGSFMNYCDYTTGESYVLCDQANCQHKSSSCGAYINGTAFAAFNGFLYALIYDAGNNAFDLTRMDLNGQNRSPIASFDIGEYIEGEYVLDRIGDVYYGYGNAYIPLEYSYVKPADSGYGNGPSKLQLLIVDLVSGGKTVIAEHEALDFYHSLNFCAISEKTVIYEVTERPDALIAEDLEDALASGELDYLNDMLNGLPEGYALDTWVNSLYLFYLDYAVYDLPQSYMLFKHDLDSGSSTVLYEGTSNTLYYTKNGNLYPSGAWQPLTCDGWYEGDLLVRFQTPRYDEDGERREDYRVERWDLETGTHEALFELSDGIFAWSEFGSVGNYVHDGGKLIFNRRTADGQSADVYSFDLETGKETFLFHDEFTGMTYRFLGENEDSFILYTIFGDNGYDAYVISKEDYLEGSIGNVRLILE